jgi:hypothetical protein
MNAACSCPRRWHELRYGRYRVPCATACDVEYARFHHHDVVELGEIAVEAELQAVTRTLALLPIAARPLERGWLLERRQRLLTARGPTPRSTPPSRRSPRTLRIEVG